MPTRDPIETVSYTHLDVYKRQRHNRRSPKSRTRRSLHLGDILLFFRRFHPSDYEFLDRADHKAENLSHEQRRHWAVSYTHLIDIPADMVTGQISQIVTKQGAVVSDWRMNYFSDMNVQGVSSEEYIQMLFCFNDGVSWNIADNRQSASIQKTRLPTSRHLVCPMISTAIFCLIL